MFTEVEQDQINLWESQKNSKALYNLAVINHNSIIGGYDSIGGYTYRSDYSELSYSQKALDLYIRASNLGNRDAQRALGDAYNSYERQYRPLITHDFDNVKSMEYYELAANNGEPLSCLKHIDHLEKRKQFDITSKRYICDKSDTKKKTELLFKAIEGYNECSDLTGYSWVGIPKNISVPGDVLIDIMNKIKYKIPKLKSQIEELQLRPPADGGALFKEAKERSEKTGIFPNNAETQNE